MGQTARQLVESVSQICACGVSLTTLTVVFQKSEALQSNNMLCETSNHVARQPLSSRVTCSRTPIASSGGGRRQTRAGCCLCRHDEVRTRVTRAHRTGPMMNGMGCGAHVSCTRSAALEWTQRSVVKSSQLSAVCRIECVCVLETCANLLDETLTILSIEPKRMVTKLHRKSLRSTGELGSPQCARRKSQELFTVPVYVSCVNNLPRAHVEFRS